MKKHYIAHLLAAFMFSASAVAHAYEEWELSARELAKIPHQKFKTVWVDAGKMWGYPKSPAATRNDKTVVGIEWYDWSWMSAEFYDWARFDNSKKLYLSGVAAMQKGSEDVSRAPENFKTVSLAFYQCMNTMVNYQKFLLDQRVPVSGSVQDIFVLCAMGRS